MTPVVENKLCALIERLDRALLTFEDADFDDAEGARTLFLEDCVCIWSALEDAVVFLHGFDSRMEVNQ